MSEPYLTIIHLLSIYGVARLLGDLGAWAKLLDRRLNLDRSKAAEDDRSA